MPSERTGYAPWSLTREAGVLSATVDGTIKVPQNVQPTIDTGFCDEKGNWVGIKSSDNEFIGLSKAVEVVDGGQALFPATSNVSHIDMTGFKDLMIAIKPTNAGNCAVKAVFGPDTIPFANLSPVNSGTPMRGAYSPAAENMNALLLDSTESLTANVWTIYYIEQRLKQQKNMQFEIINNSGGASTIEFGFMRLV